MTQLLVLAGWSITGVAAVALTPRSEPRSAWIPLAVVLGPLWLAIVLERRSVPDRPADLGDRFQRLETATGNRFSLSRPR